MPGNEASDVLETGHYLKEREPEDCSPGSG